ncbi:dephospho-CoA kinase [Desulforhopalus sp. 52FAK]
MKIAITGCYGSGKSSVSRLLADYLGATLVNTDLICKELLEPDEDGYMGLIREFGSRFISPGGQINRSLLREATFSDNTVKEKLEGILHPLVRERVRLLGKASLGSSSIFVTEVPLLFEVGWQDDFDIVVLVRVDTQTSIARTVNRDGIEKEEAKRIIDLQLSMACKEPLVDYIIDNGSTFVSTAQQTAWLATSLKNEMCEKKDQYPCGPG